MAARASRASLASGRSSGLVRFALAFALLLLGLAAVVRRQSRGLELMRAVEKARSQRAEAEAERAELLHRIDWLQSRTHVAEVAGKQGMRQPSGMEIVILPEAGAGAPAGRPARAGRPAMALR